MYLVYYYATISGHSRIKAAMLQLSNCTLSHPFYSSEAGCLNKSCLPQILVYLLVHLIPENDHISFLTHIYFSPISKARLTSSKEE